MSTFPSPSPSLAPSSRRGSASTDNTVTSTSTATRIAAAERGSLRRNRVALRDYYGLKTPVSVDPKDIPATPTLDAEQESELDKPGFHPESYVQNLMSRESLESVLRVEAGLVSDIGSLDGEKKALVYDNYSKLITAMDTIRNMRAKMDPMTPTTSTLAPAIRHIAETAANLTAEMRKPYGNCSGGTKSKEARRNEQQALVHWVLTAPDRIKGLVDEGNTHAAETEWQKVAVLLDKWNEVKGAGEVRRKCQDVMKT